MGRLLGLMLFCIGIGMVIGMLIAESAIIVIAAGLCLLCGYHLFCRYKIPHAPARGIFKFEYYALSTFPDLRQEVHTYIFLAPPVAVLTFTDLTLDFHILLDLLWE